MSLNSAYIKINDKWILSLFIHDEFKTSTDFNFLHYGKFLYIMIFTIATLNILYMECTFCKDKVNFT